MDQYTNARPRAAIKHTVQFNAENKLFIVELRSNARGEFVTVTERVNGRQNVVAIPTVGLLAVIAALKKMSEKAQEL